jgi:hypothetical protein
MELYYNDFKHYPLSSNGKIMGCGANATDECNWGDPWKNSTNQTLYMSELPQDSGGGQYYYLTDEQGTGYSFFTHLENEEDPNVVLNANGEPAYYNGTYCLIIDTVLSASTCNYAIMSTNVTTTPEIVDSY